MDWKESALDPAVAIGTLFAVCAPLSSMPYTDNWELLQLKGGSVPYEKDSIGGRLGWGPLNRSLQYAYELRTHGEREEEFPAVRPVSMKLCPPNTVVNGATFRTVGEGEFGPRHAGGLVSLSCTALRNNSQDPLFPDYIAYLSDSVDPDLQSYPLDGKPFPLTQRIGEPVGFGGMDIQGCQNSDKPVATGLETTHDNDGRLIQVKLLCGQGP